MTDGEKACSTRSRGDAVPLVSIDQTFAPPDTDHLVDHMTIVEPVDLVVQAARFAREGAFRAGLQVEQPQLPGVATHTVLVRDVRPVRRQGRTLDAGAYDPRMARRDTADDQVVDASRRERRVERVAVGARR